MEAKAMLATQAAEENLARLLRGKLSGEARKWIFGSTYATIEELIEKLKRVYAPAKSVYPLLGELSNTQCDLTITELLIWIIERESFSGVAENEHIEFNYSNY